MEKVLTRTVPRGTGLVLLVLFTFHPTVPRLPLLARLLLSLLSCPFGSVPIRPVTNLHHSFGDASEEGEEEGKKDRAGTIEGSFGG